MVVDPTFYQNTAQPAAVDTYVQATSPDVSFAGALELKVGNGGGGSVSRSLLSFDLAGLPAANRRVLGASLSLFNSYSWSCTPTPVGVGMVAQWWDRSVTWRYQPAVYAAPYTERVFAHGWSGSCPGGWEAFDVVEFARAWVEGGAPNLGFMLFAPDEWDSFQYKRFYSGETGPNSAPALRIDYNDEPGVAVLEAPADEAVVTSAEPVLTARPAVDPEGAPVRYWFRVTTGADGRSGAIVANSGWVDSPSWSPPRGALADGGVYAWTVDTSDGVLTRVNPTARRLRVNQRLGPAPVSPTDGLGGVTVNLATGNAAVTTTTGGLAAVGGSAGLTFTYNSAVGAAEQGLRVQYWPDGNRNRVFDDGQPVVTRLEPVTYVDYGAGAPAPALPADDFLARWSGYLTVPVGGSWTFGAASDDGVRIWVGGSLVHDFWVDTASVLRWGASPVTLTAGQPVPIRVEYYENAGGASLRVHARGPGFDAALPAGWLSPSYPVLPAGWTLSADADAEVGWAAARVEQAAVVLTDGAGQAHTWRYSGTGYLPPPGQEAAVLAVGADGSVTLHDGDGRSYLFTPQGRLGQVTSAVDDRNPAALGYTWEPVPGVEPGSPRLTAVRDPVSGRSVGLDYGGGACPAVAPGYVPAPAGMLCRVRWWDGTVTELRYTAAGDRAQLGTVLDPGGERTDFGYDTTGRLTRVWSPLVLDYLASRGLGLEDRFATVVGYDGSGRVGSLTGPEPAEGQARARHSYLYAPAGAAGTTEVWVDGWTASGAARARLVRVDAAGRPTWEEDAAGIGAATTWDAADRVTSQTAYTTAAVDRQRRTTYLYDRLGRLTDVYGPAPPGCLDPAGRPTAECAGSVPHRATGYDEGLTGPSVVYFDNPTLAGAPKVHATTLNGSGDLYALWGTGSPDPAIPADRWSARLTAELVVPADGTYELSAYVDDGVRVWVEDQLLLEDWRPGPARWVTGGRFTNTAGAGARKRLRVDYFDDTAEARFELHWSGPGAAGAITAGRLSPGFGLVTSTRDVDGTPQAPTSQVSVGYGPSPQLGLPTSRTVDPTGLALTTRTGYEGVAAGQYRRRLTRTLPAGNGWAYAYYGPTEARDNPCTPAPDAAAQGGLLRLATGPAPATGPAWSTETVYDPAGRPVATRVGAGAWTCISYDGRGRVTERAYPAGDGQPARTVRYEYAVAGDPRTQQVTDPVGAITTVVDLTGRTVASTDVWGVSTTTGYDQAGRVTATTTTVPGGPASTHTFGYDPAGRLLTVTANGTTLARTGYDPATGQLAEVTYANTTRLDRLTRDQADRLTEARWAFSGGASLTDTLTRSQTGRVLTATLTDTTSPISRHEYRYDPAGRLAQARTALTGAATPQLVWDYAYSPTGGCGPNPAAGANTNRTSLTSTRNGVSTTSAFCYDPADRLLTVTGPDPLTVGYDPRGNTTSLGGQGVGYDPADRHLSTTAPDGTRVTYTRDALDRIVARTRTDPAGAVTEDLRYAHPGSGDNPTLTLTNTGTLQERLIPLPGGALLSERAAAADSWAYPNLHGDLVATADPTGTRTGPAAVYDPYGQPLDPTTGQPAPGAVPDTTTGSLDYAWLGQHQRPYDPTGPYPLLTLGARPYAPTLGRFLETDPVEGGSANDYDYAMGDPVNAYDLDGQVCWSCWKKKPRHAARWLNKRSMDVHGWTLGRIATATGARGRSCGPRTRCIEGSWVVPWGAEAWTVGHTVIGRGQVSGQLLRHELVHVRQYETYGWTFLPRYDWSSIACRCYYENAYERRARSGAW